MCRNLKFPVWTRNEGMLQCSRVPMDQQVQYSKHLPKRCDHGLYRQLWQRQSDPPPDDKQRVSYVRMYNRCRQKDSRQQWQSRKQLSYEHGNSKIQFTTKWCRCWGARVYDWTALEGLGIPKEYSFGQGLWFSQRSWRTPFFLLLKNNQSLLKPSFFTFESHMGIHDGTPVSVLAVHHPTFKRNKIEDW